ncbi:ArnT family glycosyltransferase [Lentzea nigeriaca]|uniref:ArnT family glycosyltransferase n=1 Tax=Lentzea nigeriaca TaxID=1128665 RepID=UPI001957235D|nr:glycosyltransferase family 39 protein [Lentzea nigeriaca]MBM7857219.1 4-amino-4-deoxy-L-arabinose transferase-like glycosyltransferase [Lentzea nigeriaca]
MAVEEDSTATVAVPRKQFRPGPILVMIVILAVATGLRVWALGAIGLNSDEAVYAGQAASLAGDDTLSSLFPIFRAHPLLFQTVLSVGFLGGVSDVGARLLSVGFGLGTIIVVYLLGFRLYGRKAGLVAASILAVMPYHVIVTRQVLLDGPLTFFAVLTFYCVARFCLERSARWLYSAAAVLGLAVLTKEIAVILLLAVVAFFLLRHDVRVSARQILVGAGITLVIAAAYPVSLLFSGRIGTGQNYLLWQLFRRPNHSLAFYGVEMPAAVGPAVLVLAVGGLWFLRRQHSWRETLLLCWVLLPLGFFEVWPVKGYQYLLPAAPALVLLAARAITRTSFSWRHLRTALIAVVLLSLAVPSWLAVNPAPSATYLAGSGGVPAGREAGRWIKDNLPLGGNVMTLGPTMANLVRFYGNRKAYALSVSTNPLRRNPSYEPIDNPDRQLREGGFSYVVWDAYSASRTPFFSEQLMGYVEKYHGIALHTETLNISGVSTPVIIVYEVRP